MACQHNIDADADNRKARKTMEYDSISVLLRKTYQESYEKGKELTDSILNSDSPLYHKVSAAIKGVYYNMVFNEADTAYMYGDRLLKLAKNSGEDSLKNLGDYYALFGAIYHFYEDNLKKSIEAREKAIAYYEKSGYLANIPSLFMELHYRYSMVNDYDNAFRCIEQAVYWADSLNDPEAEIRAELVKAGYYEIMGNSSRAKEIYFSLNFIEEWPPFNYEYYNYLTYFDGLATTYKSLKQYDSALYYFEKLIALPDSFYTKATKANVFFCLAENYTLLNQFEKAREAIDSFAAYLPYTGTEISHNLEDDLYFLKGSLAYALQDFIAAKNMFDYVEENLNEFEDFYNMEIHKKLSDIYFNMNQYEKAYLNLRKYIVLKDSIVSEKNKKQIAEFEYRYTRDTTLIHQKETILRKESEVRSLAARQKLTLMIVVLAFIIIIVSATWWRYTERKKQEIQSLVYARDIAALRMESARNRISPHFMFNVLNHIIKSKQSFDEAGDNLQAFIRLLQSNLLNIDSVGVPLSQEIRFVRDFVMLDNLRFESNVEYSEQIAENVDVEMLIPSMALHILAENAIKHGLRPKKADKKLTIIAKSTEKMVTLSVKDNGIGRGSSIYSDGTGTGMKVLQQFINIINQNNKYKITFRFIDLKDESGEPTGTIAELSIPENLDFKL